MTTACVCPQCGTRLPSDALEGLCPKCLMNVSSGSARRFGDYELLEEVGRGGMGVVYRARQAGLDRLVAVKMILSGQFASETGKQRFQTEARAAANLRHPNLVPVHQVGEQDGFNYFSMDYIEGESLADLVREKALPPERAARYVMIMAEAIQYAHDHGVLHRDLKPSNVMIDRADQPHIMDFGLAKMLAQETELTMTGEVLGSPNYLSPEQAAGSGGAVGPATDVYSLGAMLYHLMTGHRPFFAQSVEQTLAQVKTKDPVGPRLLNPSIPADLETICLKCMEKSPSRRYQSADALAKELGRFLRGEPILARRTGRVEKVVRWCRREPVLAGVYFGSLILLVAVAIGSTWAAIYLGHKHQQERLSSYASDMFQAQTEWEAGNAAQTVYCLRKHLPGKGEPDLRGFEWRHLWRECRGDYAFVLPAHNQVAGKISFSPNGKNVAVLYWDNIIRVWNVETRTNPVVFRNVAGLGGFSEDGERFVVGYTDDTIKLHRARTGETITSIPGAGELLAVAANGRTVATRDAANEVSVWDLDEPSKKFKIPGLQPHRSDYSWSFLVTLSPDGGILAAVKSGRGGHNVDHGVRLWGTRTGVELPFLSETRQIHCLQFAPDGKSLAVGDGVGKVLVWELGTRRQKELALPGHESPILSLAFSSDGQILATGSSDQTIALWDLPAWRPMAKALRGQVGFVWSLAFSPDGKYIVSGSRESPIKFWKLAAGEPPGPLVALKSEHIGNFAFSGDSKLMAGGCRDNMVRIWDVETMAQKYALRGVNYVMAFTSDGKRVLVSTEGGAAEWWDFRENKLTPIPAYEHLGEIASVDVSPDGRLAAVGREDGVIQVLEIDSGRILGTYRGHSDAVLSVTFDPNGERFVSGGRDKAIRYWDLNVPERSLEICREHKGAVASLAISPDGHQMASACDASLIKFWDMRHLNQSVGGIPWHRAPIRSLAFSRSGATLASGSEDKTVRLWNCTSRAQLASFNFDDKIRLVEFSPDDNNLAVVTDNGTLTLLHAVSLREADGQAGLLGVLR